METVRIWNLGSESRAQRCQCWSCRMEPLSSASKFKEFLGGAKKAILERDVGKHKLKQSSLLH